jgi:hypothetical protein
MNKAQRHVCRQTMIKRSVLSLPHCSVWIEIIQHSLFISTNAYCSFEHKLNDNS